MRTRLDNGYPSPELEAFIARGDEETRVLAERAGGRILSRRHPKPINTDETCTVIVDECGAHSLEAKEKFPVFTLAAVIVRDHDYPKLDRAWRRWKREYLGSPDKLVHESDIRSGRESFWCSGDSARRRRAIAALDTVLGRLPCAAIACVVHRENYLARYPGQTVNATVPGHPYLMTLHYLAERLAIALHEHFGGAKARLVFESRGPREDATMQYEFTRLFLDGTAYVSDSWFRRQFHPGVEFRGKDKNTSGLQLADLIARPCGEKVADPASDPPRWQAIRQKLCPGVHTAHSILGLKIVPWDDLYVDVWKS